MGLISKKIELIMEKSTWAKALLWLVASQIVYFIMLYVTIPAIQSHVNDMRIFDLMPFGYSQHYAITLLEELGVQGRNIYLTKQIPLDLIFPFLNGVTGALFISLLAKKIKPSLKVLVLLPVFAALFDYLENFMVATMLLSFPDISKSIVTLSSIFTISKSFLTTLYLTLILFLLVIFLYKALRSRIRP